MSAMHFLRGLLSSLAVLCLLPAFGQPTTAYFTNYAPQWSPDGEKILFTSTREGKAGVYLMDKDGANQTRLTPNDGNHSNPVWSPDGKRILYLKEREGASFLFITDAAGAHHRNISPPGVKCYAPAWSPDGNTIAFQGISQDNPFSGVFVTRADGSDWNRLAAGEPYQFGFPRWVPGSGTIACVATGQYGVTLRTIAIDNPRSRKAIDVQSGGLTRFSPKGPGVLLGRPEGLYYLSELDKRPIRLTDFTVVHFNWSPDGESVLYVAGSENGKNAIYLHHIASGVRRQLTPAAREYGHVSFSPDGKTLLYNSSYNGFFEVYTANADGTNPRRLTHFQNLNGTAQVTIYFNQAWRITKKESFAYYRKASLDTNRQHFNGPFEDYDSTGHLIMDGSYAYSRKNGPYTTYHLNGSKASQGNYRDNQMQGRWEYYYPNGKLKQVIDFTDTDYRIVSFFDSLGNARVTEGTGAWYDYFGDNARPILLTGRVVNGLRQGEWIITARTGERLLEETFEMGAFKGGTQYSGKHGKKSGSSLLGKQLFEYPHLELAELLRGDKHFYGPDALDYILGRDPFQSVDPALTPSFPGGEANFAQFMARHLLFPTGAVYRHAEGKVVVECLVDEDGRLYHFRIRQGAAPDLNFEAVRVLKLSPLWLPAKLPDGTPQKSRVLVPVLFRFDTPKGS